MNAWLFGNRGKLRIDNVDMIDLRALVRLLPGRPSWNEGSTQARYVTAIVRRWEVLRDNDIDTPLRVGHFIGQGLIETGYLRYAVENLNYSPEGLMRVFPRYYSTLAAAQAHARKPETIANHVYGGRMGNTAPGDGWRYRGRGFFQLTGKDNYARFGRISGVDLVTEPESIERDLGLSIAVAAAFWKHMGLAAFADRNDGRAISRAINRGDAAATRPAHGEDERLAWTASVLGLLDDPAGVIKPEFKADAPAPAGRTLELGLAGEDVRRLQRDLLALGYALGGADGRFGPNTRRAVESFQREQGLETDGRVGPATRARLAEELADLRPLPTTRRP